MFKHAYAPAQKLLEAGLTDRILAASNDECSLAAAQQKIEAWRSAGRFSVFTAGAYDILGLNHIKGLAQCRALGAMSILGLEVVEADTDFRCLHATAASEAVGLMVTVDTNTALEEGKSRRADKGGAPKPTFDWQTRATMLAMQSIPATEPGHRINLVDYITQHGPGCCLSCSDGTCINEDNARMVVSLQPNMVVVSTGSTQTIRDLSGYKADGLLPKTELIAIDEQEGAYFDSMLGGLISTTAVINRIKS